MAGAERTAPNVHVGLVLDVFRHAPQLCFRRVDIAGGVDGDAFPHGAIGRIRRHVGRNEHRHFPVFETPDPDPPLPARVNPFGRLRVGRVDDVVPVDGQPAGAAEVVVFTDELPILRQDLNAMVVAIGDNQPALGIELERVRRPELARPCSGLADRL